MKANELRIGNLVFEEKGYPAMARIVGIKENNIIEIYSFMANNGADFNYECECSSCEPIPLTEEWLLRFGFKKKEHTYELGWFIVFFSEFSEYGLWLEDNEGGVLNDKAMKYVHQLQNLYFALTGEELKIKNP